MSVEWTTIGPCRLACGDCLDVLPTLEAGSVDSVVTDPPYGIGAAKRSFANPKKRGSALAASKDYGDSNWDASPPPIEAFEEMRRVSKEQVIFGGNYFAHMLPSSPSWIVWDKDNGENGYADFELAWTSHKRAARKVRWRWHGFMQEPGHPKDERVHPTQKPAGLFEWVLNNYTTHASTILDPYMGSATTGVACVKTGRKFIGIEKEPKYFDIACKRIEKAVADVGLLSGAVA